MDCIGTIAPPDEIACVSGCRTAWYNAMIANDAAYAAGTITALQWAAQVKVLGSQLDACVKGCHPSGQGGGGGEGS